MANLTSNEKVSAGQLAVYSIFLLCGIYLCIKHGFGRTAGFLYIVIFSLARIIGDAMLLATIQNPDDFSLYIGWAVLNGIGLTILILVSLGLLLRLFNGLGRDHPVKPMFQLGIQLLLLISLILQIVGGTQAHYTITPNGYNIKYPILSKVATALTIVVVGFVILQAAYLASNRQYIRQGENRVLWGVIASFPFIIVRLVYSCLVIYDDTTASVWLNLGMAVIMEIMAILIYIIVGFVITKVPKKKQEDSEMRPYAYNNVPPAPARY